MELCAGGSVTDLLEAMAKKLETPSLNEEEIAYIVAEVCNALVYLHGHCRIHRDVKGNNILLTETGSNDALSRVTKCLNVLLKEKVFQAMTPIVFKTYNEKRLFSYCVLVQDGR